MTNMPILYSWGTLVISKRAMKKVKRNDRKLVSKILGKAFDEINQKNYRDSAAALAAIKNQGIEFIKPNTQQYQQWRDIAVKGNQKLIEEGYNSREMYDLMMKYINEYRSQH